MRSAERSIEPGDHIAYNYHPVKGNVSARKLLMVAIKRYPNRKLYNTETKQYITLQGIADLIREGEEVQVTDHASGDDLTALTLTQIILEQEKRQDGLLSNSFLTGLIRTGGERLSFFRQEGLTILEEQLEKRLRQLQIPTHADLQELYDRLEGLASKLDEIVGANAIPADDDCTSRRTTGDKFTIRTEVKE
jgi:polyhydroxyalkanoate synthesis repressor PhaR